MSIHLEKLRGQLAQALMPPQQPIENIQLVDSTLSRSIVYLGNKAAGPGVCPPIHSPLLGTLGSKASVTFKSDYGLTDEELLQA